MPRKIVPTKIKLLQGTFRKERGNPDEPFYPDEIPAPPDHLSETALKEWIRISDVLFQKGLLSSVDMAGLAGYCVSFGRWADAETELKGSSLLIKTTSGNILQNPLIGIANKAMEHMRKFIGEFGLTPASRPKISVKKSKKQGDPWADFGTPTKRKKK